MRSCKGKVALCVLSGSLVNFSLSTSHLMHLPGRLTLPTRQRISCLPDGSLLGIVPCAVNTPRVPHAVHEPATPGSTPPNGRGNCCARHLEHQKRDPHKERY